MAETLEDVFGSDDESKPDTLESVFEPPKKERRRTEAFLEGAADTVSGGFVDEGTGGVVAALERTGVGKWIGEKTGLMWRDADGNLHGASGMIEDRAGKSVGSAGDSYRAGRDSKREDVKELRADEGTAFGLGQATGAAASMLVPGKAATSLVGKLGRGVAEGAARGIGTSEADLTKGDVAGIARDAAIGGSVGLLAGGISAAGGKLASKLAPKSAPSAVVPAAATAPIAVGEKVWIKSGDKYLRNGVVEGIEKGGARISGAKNLIPLKRLEAVGNVPVEKAAKQVAEKAVKETSKTGDLVRAGRDIAVGYAFDKALEAAGKEGLPVGAVLGALSAARRMKKGGGGELSAKMVTALAGKKFTEPAIRALVQKMPEASAKVFAGELVRLIEGNTAKPVETTDSLESVFGE